jgi:hypothetical protein
MVETNRKQKMRRRLIRWLWWAVFVTSVLFLLASLPGYSLKPKDVELSGGFGTIQQLALWLAMLLSIVSAVLSLALALLVFIKRPGEPMAIYLSFSLLFFGIFMVGPLELFLLYWFPHSADLALLLQAILFPTFGLALILVFPNGHFNPRWARWLLVISVFLNGYMFLAFNPEELVRMTTARAQAGNSVMAALLLVCIAIQIYRFYQVYSLTERQQTKWVLIGLAAMFFLQIILGIPYYYELNLPPGTPQPWWVPLGSVGWSLSLMILPVTLTIAILRYRLFDIDVIIRKTLIYGALTAILAIVFFGGVLLMQQITGRISGTQDSPVAIVISTLVIAALFTPLRNRIQRDIDRRFFRKKYDAARTLEAFSARIREDVELDQLTTHLLVVVEETMQPETITLWLRSIDNRSSRSEL